MSKLYKDNEVNLQLNNLQIDYLDIYNSDIDNISEEEAEFINIINPKMLVIKRIK